MMLSGAGKYVGSPIGIYFWEEDFQHWFSSFESVRQMYRACMVGG